ncbi:MAG: hypothetical protein K8E66_09745 [Phycisphaerales bacterium]|nr:hypothetical protein [Phycisphaerales bacterium]
MGKPQPKLTAAIVIALIAATGGAVWWVYRSTYTQTMHNQSAPSPTDLVNLRSLPRDQPERFLDRDLENVVLDLERRGFERFDPGTNSYVRRSEVEDTGYLIDEVVQFDVDDQTGLIVGVVYTRTTDAPVKIPYLEIVAP